MMCDATVSAIRLASFLAIVAMTIIKLVHFCMKELQQRLPVVQRLAAQAALQIQQPTPSAQFRQAMILVKNV